VSPRSRELPGLDEDMRAGESAGTLHFPRGNPLAENLSCPTVGIGFPSFAPLCSYRARFTLLPSVISRSLPRRTEEKRSKGKRTSGRSHFYNVSGRLIDKWTTDIYFTVILVISWREKEADRRICLIARILVKFKIKFQMNL